MSIASPPNAATTFLQQGNGAVLISWNQVPGATSYSIQRSIDGMNFSNLATVAAFQYLDTTVTPGTVYQTGGTQYWYQVASVNASGTSSYTQASQNPGTFYNSIVPATAGVMSLQQIRMLSQSKADRLNSNFVILPEWNAFINLAADELYDLITTTYEDYGMYQPVYFTTNGNQSSYNLPDGVTTFQNAAGQNIVPPPIYKLAGIDLGLNNAANGFVTVQKYNFIDRNRYVFPNTASTIYGVFGLQYRFLGNVVNFIPQPSSNQPIGIRFIPRRTQLLQETDVTDGFGGWNQYVICRAAKYALDKEESSTDKLDAEILYLKQRIEESAPNRDEGQADTISDTRMASGFGPDGGGGWSGPFGTGW
jgi:hypothetical protein